MNAEVKKVGFTNTIFINCHIYKNQDNSYQKGTPIYENCTTICMLFLYLMLAARLTISPRYVAFWKTYTSI